MRFDIPGVNDCSPVHSSSESKDGDTLFDRIVENLIEQSRRREVPDPPEAEQIKEAAKARARRKARLDAYFRLLERSAMKQKLIEQENAKRAYNKKYRYSVSRLNCIVNSTCCTPPPRNPEFFF